MQDLYAKARKECQSNFAEGCGLRPGGRERGTDLPQPEGPRRMIFAR